MPKTQQKYGQGWDVHYPEENGSWEFHDGVLRATGLPQTDGLEQTLPS
jgi:hypothetical protein